MGLIKPFINLSLIGKPPAWVAADCWVNAGALDWVVKSTYGMNSVLVIYGAYLKCTGFAEVSVFVVKYNMAEMDLPVGMHEVICYHENNC